MRDDPPSLFSAGEARCPYRQRDAGPHRASNGRRVCIDIASYVQDATRKVTLDDAGAPKLTPGTATADRLDPVLIRIFSLADQLLPPVLWKTRDIRYG